MKSADQATVVAEDVSKVFFSGSDPVWALETGGRRGSPAYSVLVSPTRLETRTDPLQTSPLTPTTQRGGGAV